LMLVAACGGNDGPSIPTPTPVGSSEGQRHCAGIVRA